MFIDSDGAGSGNYVHGLLYSPVMDASDAGALFLEFDQYYQHLGANCFSSVQVFDGADWVEVLFQNTTTPNHQVIDVTAYANSDFQVRFEFDDGNHYAWYWAIDNVTINN